MGLARVGLVWAACLNLRESFRRLPMLSQFPIVVQLHVKNDVGQAR